MTDPYDLDRFVSAWHKARPLDVVRVPAARGSRSQRHGETVRHRLDRGGPRLPAHPLLGARLRETVGALQDLTDVTAEAVFGSVDAVKLRSSLTLFAEAGGGPLFDAALARWFGDRRDQAPLDLLGR